MGVLATEALRGAMEQRDLAKLRVAIAQEREADDGVIEVGLGVLSGATLPPTFNLAQLATLPATTIPATPSYNHHCHPTVVSATH